MACVDGHSRSEFSEPGEVVVCSVCECDGLFNSQVTREGDHGSEFSAGWEGDAVDPGGKRVVAGLSYERSVTSVGRVHHLTDSWEAGSGNCDTKDIGKVTVISIGCWEGSFCFTTNLIDNEKDIGPDGMKAVGEGERTSVVHCECREVGTYISNVGEVSFEGCDAFENGNEGAGNEEGIHWEDAFECVEEHHDHGRDGEDTTHDAEDMDLYNNTEKGLGDEGMPVGDGAGEREIMEHLIVHDCKKGEEEREGRDICRGCRFLDGG